LAATPELAERVLRQICDMFSTGDASAADRVFAPEYVDHQGLRGEKIRGPAGFRRVVEAARSAYAALDVRFADMQTEGDRITARFHWLGTAKDGGRATERETAEVLRIAGGRVVEHWGTRVS